MKLPYRATFRHLIPALLMPLVVFALISSEAVWYGQGIGAIGAVMVIVCYLAGLISALATVLASSGWLRLAAAIVLMPYLYAVVIQFF